MVNNDAVVVHDLVVVRGGATVLPGLSLRVPRGQVVGLLGPSGGGKTTLLRAIVGVQVVRSGTIEVLGRPAGSASLRSTVGYVTQAPSVFADLTVRQNLRYFGALVGAAGESATRSGKQTVAEAAERTAAAVGLADKLDATVQELSGGQRSRVSLAAGLIGSPELLVLDEPTVGLDPVLRRDLWELFHRLADGGTTLLVSSHVMDEASRCDRLLLLRQGRILADATPAELLQQTGAADTEQAFLTLIDRAEAA